MSCYTDWTIVGIVAAGAPLTQNQNPGGYKSLQVWCSNNTVTGVKLLLNDDPNDSGAAALVGQTNGDTQTINLSVGVLLKSLTMWPSGNGDSIVGITATTSDDQTLSIGNTGSKAGTAAVECWVGSGFLTGVQGTFNTSNGVLSSLGFCFFKPIANVSMEIDDAMWWGGVTAGLQLDLQTLSESTFTNQTQAASTYTFANSVARTDSRTTETTFSKTWGGSVTLTAKIPEIVDVSATAQWSTTQGTNVSNTTSIERTLEWNLSGNLPALTTITCRSACWQGLIDVWFNCTVNVLCKDNSNMSFPSGGRSTAVLYSLVTADVVSVRPYTTPASLLQRTEEAEKLTQGKNLAIEDNKVATANATITNGNGHQDFASNKLGTLSAT